MNVLSWLLLTAIVVALIYALIQRGVSSGIQHAGRKREQQNPPQPPTDSH